MHFSLAIISALFICTSLAAPYLSPRQDEQTVFNSINSWISDVDAVTAFLNAAPGLTGTTEIQNGAVNALMAAFDEPTQLSILQGTPGLSAAGQNAATILSQVFPSIPNDLIDIANNPGNLQADVNDINNVRCSTVLPNIDILWVETAAAVGARNPPTANRPMACSA